MKELNKLRTRVNRVDLKLQKLFKKRMMIVKEISEIKKENHLETLDVNREYNLKLLLSEEFHDDDLLEYYLEFVTSTLNISKDYQNDVSMVKNITVCRGALNYLDHYMNLDKKTLIVTDSNVPKEIVENVKKQFKNAIIFEFKTGEESKTISTALQIIDVLIENEFSKDDCIIAVGGGVTTDLTGFVASIYKRGITYYSIPTTLLAMVDAAIGGKTAVNYQKTKNMIGAFYLPKRIIVDCDTLNYLPKRLFNEGMAEIIKIGFISSKELIEEIEKDDYDIEDIVCKAINLKLRFVMFDFYDQGVRNNLNFGHTIGHAIEASSNLLHGEAIALGMVYFTGNNTIDRLKKLLHKYELLNEVNIEPALLVDKVLQDKKVTNGKIKVIYLDDIEKPKFEYFTKEELLKYILMVQDHE